MPSRRRSSGPPWQVILEDIQSQNRATIEAVQVSHDSLSRRMDDLALEVRQNTRDIQQNTREIQQNTRHIQQNTLDIQQNTRDIQQNTRDIQQNTLGINDLAAKVEALGPIEGRVAALERGRR